MTNELRQFFVTCVTGTLFLLAVFASTDMHLRTIRGGQLLIAAR
jgi:hypothetical protein